MRKLPRPARHARYFVALALFAAAPALPAMAQTVTDTAEILPSYAETADRVIGAPMIIDAVVRSTAKITGAEAASVPAGMQRLYVTADVQALIRGTQTVPARIGYLVDMPMDARGRVANLRRQRVVLFARAIPNRPTDVQLIRGDSQQPWSAGLDRRVRGIVGELLAANAPPAVTGLGNAFHVPGSLPGEGETQVFVLTETGAPVSLSILRRPGEQRRWSVSLGEIVDQAAEPPPRDTLLWYRLACGLPAELPASSISADSPETAAIARDDYRFVLQSLGNCPVRR